MKFYDRKNEIEELRNALALSKKSAQFTVVTGRRRIGKTTLVRKAYEGETLVYFFVARKSEKELCAGFKKEMEQKLGFPILGEIGSFADIFEYLMKLSQNQGFTLFIDEFQDFFRVNPSVFSDMQRIWDEYHDKSKINLIVCGSIYSMMTTIFQNNKEPLYNRENRFMKVKPFKIEVVKEILKDYNSDYTSEDLLALYLFTGGVAKYVKILMDSGALTRNEMIRQIINPNSSFIGEGKAMLIEEFGKEYGIYFSILTAIAGGKTSRSEIENTVGKEIGGYLTRLEDHYEVISKHYPIFEKKSQRNIRYKITDNFLQFWFRFVFRYQYMVELDNYEAMREVLERDYDTYSGIILERYFRQFLAESGRFTRIGSWWDRKGENEIDIVAENELDKTLLLAEVKRNRKNYSKEELIRKSAAFFNSVGDFKDYTVRYKGLSLKEM